jgi:glucosamine-6-phosphate deaminase
LRAHFSAAAPRAQRDTFSMISGRQNRAAIMLVRITEDYADLSREAARIVAHAIHAKPNLCLGLATGTTPVGLYKELIRLHREESLDFSRVVTFNLDEYIGISAAHPASFNFYMRNNFFDHVNVREENIHIPEGLVRENFDQYCQEYEDLIRTAGGIDLQILGLGKEGHIAFNEPSSSLASRTRPKVLTRATLDDNRRFFADDEDPPRAAITMGIGTILESRRVLLLASGAAKAHAVALAVEGPITSSVSASALQLHRDVTILVDRPASANLAHRDYYEDVLHITRNLTPNRLW